MINVAESGHYHGDCRELLRMLPPKCVQTCITSPPYWGLRSYFKEDDPRHKQQLGLEETPGEYVEAIVGVFREVRRVLHDSGTLWINLGDSYAGSRSGPHGESGEMADRTVTKHRVQRLADNNRSTTLSGGTDTQSVAYEAKTMRKTSSGLKPKDLIGIPWMVAFALRADGWYLRCDIVWSKPNPMPESVIDRPTKAHEYIFLMSKSPVYYYDGDAIREPTTGNAHPRGDGVNPKAALDEPGSKQNSSWSSAVKDVGRRRSRSGNGFKRDARRTFLSPDGTPTGSDEHWEDVTGLRNKRSVWTVQSQPYAGAHFACFPPKLIEPCVLAGSRVGDLVLDPFFGSGTTGQVAEKHGRRWIGFDLGYSDLAKQRTAQRSLVLGAK